MNDRHGPNNSLGELDYVPVEIIDRIATYGIAGNLRWAKVAAAIRALQEVIEGLGVPAEGGAEPSLTAHTLRLVIHEHADDHLRPWAQLPPKLQEVLAHIPDRQERQRFLALALVQCALMGLDRMSQKADVHPGLEPPHWWHGASVEEVLLFDLTPTEGGPNNVRFLGDLQLQREVVTARILGEGKSTAWRDAYAFALQSEEARRAS